MHSISVPRIVSGRYHGLQEKGVRQGLVIGSRQDAARGLGGGCPRAHSTVQEQCAQDINKSLLYFGLLYQTVCIATWYAV